MKRARVLAAAAFVAAFALVRAPASAHLPPVTTRSFTITANAFPVQAAPGNNGTVIAVSPAAVQLQIANPPGSSYARAAALDTGFLEQYTGPPPAGTFAECSTETANIDRHAQATPDGMTLRAHCNDAPSALATAAASDLSAGGMTAASVVSSVTGGPHGSAVRATEDVVVRDGTLGPLRFALARYTATIEADGLRGGAVARATLNVVEASFSGIPVVIGSDGLLVDKTRVPLEMVGQLTSKLHALLLSSRYHDVRLVQPKMMASPDGARANVSGGGIVVYGTNDNPAGTYFAGATLLGGSLDGVVGDPLDLPSVLPVPVPPLLQGAPTPVQNGVITGTPPRLYQPAVPLVAVSRARDTVPIRWPGLPWALGAIGLLALAWIARGPQIVRHLDAIAERYLRG